MMLLLIVLLCCAGSWAATPMRASITYTSQTACKAASTTISYGGECYLNQTGVCNGNSLEFVMPSLGQGAACSWANLQGAQSFTIESYSSISFLYDTDASCNASKSTVNSICTNTQNLCVTQSFWSGTNTCNYCSAASMTVDAITGLISAGALGNC